jgi:two-component system chemotaxis response regulator CheB
MATQKPRTKVYVIDDSLTFRAMLDTLVSRDDDLEICGMAADAETALDDINGSQPKIILLDQTLPGMDSLAFLDALKDHWHGTNVIMISSSGENGIEVCHLAQGKALSPVSIREG